MSLKISVDRVWCHPEFGGEQREQHLFELAGFIRAEDKYRELSKNDSLYQHTTINIIELKEGGEIPDCEACEIARSVHIHHCAFTRESEECKAIVRSI